MAKQSINIGTIANDGTGTNLRDGGDLINDNFNEIYTELGDGSSLDLGGKTVTFTNKTISGSSNTLTNIANSSLSNSSITFAGDSGSDSASLGETYTIAGGTSISTTATSNTLTVNLSSINATTTSITNVPTPSADGDPAPKSYVDAVAEGLHVHAPAQAATTDALATLTGDTVAYDNGSSGVGATLTLSTALTTLDGYTLQNGDRIIVKDESNQAHNGIYTWATGGTVLTRATDMDTPTEAAGGDFIFVQEGTTFADTGFVQSETVTTIGSDNFIFVQFSGAESVTAGAGLSKAGVDLSVNVDDSSIEIDTDTLQVKALGVTNAMLAGSIANAKLTNSSITINGTGVSLGGSINVGDITGVTAGTGLTGGGTTGAVTLNVSGLTVSELAAGSLTTSAESFADNDTTLMTSAAINDRIESFGYTTNSGDITGVTAGSGLTGGGTSGGVTLNVGAGTGIDVAADSIAVDVSDFMSNGSNNRVVTATGTDAMNAEANMTFDGSTLAVTGAITATGDITAFYTSDISLKENIKNIENPLDKINQINGVTYDWTQDALEKYSHLENKNDVGVIAQEIEKVLPQITAKREDGTKAVKYDRIVALLIEGIKDLNKQVSDLKTEIEELKK